MAIAFAGSLSRWFASTGAAAGVDPARLRVGVEAWRRDLCASVAPKVAEQLVWDEGAAAQATSDLGDAGWIALRLLAFYGERAEFEWPDTTPPLLELDHTGAPPPTRSSRRRSTASCWPVASGCPATSR